MKRMLLVIFVILAFITVLTISQETGFVAAAPGALWHGGIGQWYGHFGGGGCPYDDYGYSTHDTGVTNCIENDGGMKPCKYGGVSFRDGSGQTQHLWDSCFGTDGFLSEYVCAGSEVHEYNIDCTNGCQLDSTGVSARCRP